MQQYYETRDVAEILGCSASKARQIMLEMPHLRVVRGKGSKIRVKISDYEQYISDHTVQPDQFQPRTTPFPTLEAQTKAWHKGKKT